MMKTFAECKAVLDRTRYGKRKALCVKTYMAYVDNCNAIAIVYHKTAVVVHHRDGSFTLNMGGWPSPTTRKRMCQYSGARVSQRKYEQLVEYKGKTYHYQDGMTCYPNGEVTLAREVA